MRQPICFFLAGLCFVCAALPQTATITVIGQTVTNLDAIAFRNGTLFGATAARISSGSLYTINTSTGAATLVGPLVGASNASLTYAITGLAAQPGTGTLYGSTSHHSANSPGNLVTVNPSTGQVTVIGPFGPSTTAADLAFAPAGTLYGSMVKTPSRKPQLGTINLSTGAATLIGPAMLSPFGDGSGLASDSTGALFYSGAATGGPLDNVNPSNGAATMLATLTAGNNSGDMIAAMDFSPSGVLFGVENGVSNAYLIRIAYPGSTTPPSPVPIPSSLLLALTGLAGVGLFLGLKRIRGSATA